MSLSSLLLACSRDRHAPAVIEQTSGGYELLEQEFGECDEGGVDGVLPNPPTFQQAKSRVNNASSRYQTALEKAYPHIYSSLNKEFPLRGSWRHSKAEILDLVDRYIYSPSLNKGMPLLYNFDLVLLVNVAPRTSSTATHSSAQRMQVMARNGASNKLGDWKRLQTWPISSGRPCLKKDSKGRLYEVKIETPTGVYKFDKGRMYPEYKSTEWDGADMYESMFLQHQYQNGRTAGVAIHGTYKTDTLGRKDSGGCIRLYRDYSKCLYQTITGGAAKNCLGGGKIDYWGRVPSMLARNGEADPEFLSSGGIEVDGYRVLIAIYKDDKDLL